MEEPKENKGLRPASNKALVRVRVKPGRAVEGIGGPGSTASVDEKEAKRLARIGYVEIVEEA